MGEKNEVDLYGMKGKDVNERKVTNSQGVFMQFLIQKSMCICTKNVRNLVYRISDLITVLPQKVLNKKVMIRDKKVCFKDKAKTLDLK